MSRTGLFGYSWADAAVAVMANAAAITRPLTPGILIDFPLPNFLVRLFDRAGRFRLRTDRVSGEASARAGVPQNLHARPTACQFATPWSRPEPACSSARMVV